MKTLGLIGDMGWESTAVYHRLLNEFARDRMGGRRSTRLLTWSSDFADVAALRSADDWKTASQRLVEAATSLERAGADALLICTGTMHWLADDVEFMTRIPVLHIADATAAAMRKAGVTRSLLLDTPHTMEQAFYRGRLQERHGLDVVVPERKDRRIVNGIVFNERCHGIVDDISKSDVLSLIGRYRSSHNIDGVILGCKEFGLLVEQAGTDLALFDATALHAEEAMRFALQA